MNKNNILHQMFIMVYHLKKEFSKIVGHYNLTEMEAKFLFHIGKGHTKTSELICYFEKHKSTIRQKTKSLEEKGYITSAFAQGDKREKISSFTQKGQDFFKEMEKLKKQHYKKVFRKLSEKEVETLGGLLEKLDIGSH